MGSYSDENLQELSSFIGLVNYYARLIPNSASILHTLKLLMLTGFGLITVRLVLS